MQNTTNPGGGVLIGTRAEIYPAEALPDFNSTGGPAFVARQRGDASTGLIGIICHSGLTRSDLVSTMRAVDHPGILRLVDHGVVHWPTNNTHCMAYVFQRPLSLRLSQNIDEVQPTLSEDALNHYFIIPMIGALLELQRTGIAHNAINPMNIFWRVGATTIPQLGECLSAPAGMGQPAMYDPLERATCQPLGRGAGTHADDCYSFGMTVAKLMFGHNPFKGMADKEIIQLKTERGSFGAVVGNRRLPPTHIELLRGLLADDARQRWSAANLEQWQNGRRLTPKNTDIGKRASRAMEFAGKEYWQPRPLANGLTENIGDAVHMLENGAIDKWLRRSLGDEDRADHMATALKGLKESGKTANYDDQLVARACMALDPAAPIRYRGIAAMPAGVSSLLVDALDKGKNLQAISEIISNQLVTLWVEMQREPKPEQIALGQQFERMRNLTDRTSFGNGLERIAYELNPGLPCQSPFLRSLYVTTPKGVLTALERVATDVNRPRDPVDRHLAAFLIVRDRRSESMFEAMTAPENSPRRGIAFLSLFGEMQTRYGPDALPGLAQWILPFLDVSVNRFLGKNLRDSLRAQIKETAGRGDLTALLQLIDDPRRVERDRQEFTAARMLYFNIMKEAAGIEHKLNNRTIIVQSMGKPMAATLCSFIAIIFVVLAVARAGLQALFQ